MKRHMTTISLVIAEQSAPFSAAEVNAQIRRRYSTAAGMPNAMLRRVAVAAIRELGHDAVEGASQRPENKSQFFSDNV